MGYVHTIYRRGFCACRETGANRRAQTVYIGWICASFVQLFKKLQHFLYLFRNDFNSLHMFQLSETAPTIYYIRNNMSHFQTGAAWSSSAPSRRLQHFVQKEALYMCEQEDLFDKVFVLAQNVLGIV